MGPLQTRAQIRFADNDRNKKNSFRNPGRAAQKDRFPRPSPNKTQSAQCLAVQPMQPLLPPSRSTGPPSPHPIWKPDRDMLPPPNKHAPFDLNHKSDI